MATLRHPDSTLTRFSLHPLHAALRLPRTGAAARADDARRRVERLGDPLDVEHLRGSANADGGLLRNHAVAAAGIRAASQVLNIEWIAEALDSPASVICPRSGACPRQPQGCV